MSDFRWALGALVPLAALVLMAGGCGSDAGGPATCNEGELSACFCADGSQAMQQCIGGIYTPCSCGDGVGGGTAGDGAASGATTDGSQTGSGDGAMVMDPVGDAPGDTLGMDGMGGDMTTDPGMDMPALASSGCGANDFPADGPGSFDIQGVTREYIVTLPDGYDPNTEYRLIFAWHGQGGTAEQTANGWFGGNGYLGLQGRANNTAIFATGQGLPAFGGASGWADDNDFPFVQQLIDHIKGNYCVDENRVFSTGASFGGIMSNRIGCNLGDQLRAIAPIMGSGPTSFFGNATCTGQVAAWLTHGRNDQTVTFDQGEASRDHWLSANNCGTTTSANGVGECVAYDGCDPGYPVVWCPTDLGHTLPDYASEEIWKFFEQF